MNESSPCPPPHHRPLLKWKILKCVPVPRNKGLTASTTDIDTVVNATAMANAAAAVQHDAQQQYSLHRLYASRKLSTANLKFSNHDTAGGMTHSQSTGDVATMFGRAWRECDAKPFQYHNNNNFHQHHHHHTHRHHHHSHHQTAEKSLNAINSVSHA